MDSESHDGALIAAIRAGDTARFDELARRYGPPLWRAARSRLGRDDAADDAVQETFLAAYRWLGSYDSRYSFRTWLWTILLNHCRRTLGKVGRRREVSAHDQDSPGCLAGLLAREAGPQETLLSQERAERLEGLLRQLPDPTADALRLRFFGELRFQEIADVLRCSLSTAKIRVRAGLLQLAEWLADDEPGEWQPSGTGEERDLP